MADGDRVKDDHLIPDPVRHDHLIPDPVRHDHLIPEPVRHDPLIPDPVRHDHLIPDPVRHDHLIPDPVRHDQLIPDPVRDDHVIPDPVIVDQENCCIKLKKFLIERIEPVIFLFMFSFILNITCLTTLIKELICLRDTNFTKDMCSSLDIPMKERNQVETKAGDYDLCLNWSYILGAAFSIFFAPFSDKYGRKPMLLFGLFGFFISECVVIACSLLIRAPLLYIILALNLSQVTGGVIGVMTCIYSHVSEISSEDNSTRNYASLQFVFGLAVLAGALSGEPLRSLHYGNWPALTIVAACQFVSILWVVFVIKETRNGADENGAKWFKDLCWSENCFGCKSLTKSRDNVGRLLLCLLLSTCIYELTYEATVDFPYVFSYHMYGWEVENCSKNWMFYNAAEITAFLFLTIIFLKLRVTDACMGIISALSMKGKFAFMAVACNDWLIIISNTLGILNGFGSLAVKSMISKFARKDECAQIFSYLVTCETLVPLICHLLGARMFKSLNAHIPGLAYMTAYAMFVIPLSVFIGRKKKQD